MTDDTKTCPICAEDVRLAAQRCRYCGHDFTGRAADWGGPAPVVKLQEKHQLGCLSGGLIFLVVAMIWNQFNPAPESAPVQPPRSGSGNPSHDRLAAMTEGARRALLTTYVRSNGDRCGQVTRTLFRGMSAERQAFWSVRCRPGQDLSLMISPDRGGSVRILECSTLRLVARQSCWQRYQ